jgi:Holliday junction resolvase RusA-like endonuclease
VRDGLRAVFYVGGKMRFEISGKPRGKGRPRFYNGHAVTPADTRNYESETGWMYRKAGGILHEGPVEIRIIAHFKIPESATKARKAEMWKNPTACVVKPDADNIAKVILDGLNGVAYRDDASVVRLDVRKMWDEKAYVEVWVMPCGSIDHSTNE